MLKSIFTKSNLKSLIPKKNQILDLVSSLLTAIVICIFLFVFVVVPSEVEGSSMQPNFDTGDRLYTFRFYHWLSGTQIGQKLGIDYNRGDIVVVDKPGHGNSIIKRIIGMPGDRLTISDGKVFINGKQLIEPYLPSSTKTFLYENSFFNENQEIEISCGKVLGQQDNEDCYFVMGDNRGGSSDSRSRELGIVRRSWIQGKVLLRIWPLHKFAIFQTPEYFFKK